MSHYVTLQSNHRNMFNVDESKPVPKVIYLGTKENLALPAGQRQPRARGTGARTDTSSSYVAPQVSDSRVLDDALPAGFAGWTKLQILKWQAKMRQRWSRIKKAAAK